MQVLFGAGPSLDLVRAADEDGVDGDRNVPDDGPRRHFSTLELDDHVKHRGADSLGLHLKPHTETIDNGVLYLPESTSSYVQFTH